MTEDLYRCSCGKGFKTAQGLAGHKRFCKEVTHLPEAEEHIKGLLPRFSKLEQDYEELSQLYEGSLDRLNQLEKKVDLVAGYVCPAGRNLVGVTGSRIIELSGRLSALESEMDASQKEFEREIKAWVWNVIPEPFRPKL
jgi:hypothetical protein